MSAPRIGFLGLVATFLFLGSARAQTSTADLIPADASGFFHLPLAELAKDDALKPYREMRAGEAFALFERRVAPPITSLDRLLGYVRVTDPRVPPTFVFILTTTKDVDAVALVKQWIPEAREEN